MKIIHLHYDHEKELVYNSIHDNYYLIDKSISNLIKIIWEKGIDTLFSFKIEEYITITFESLDDFQNFYKYLKGKINLLDWKFEIIPVCFNNYDLLNVKICFHKSLIQSIQDLLTIEND